VDLGRWWTYQKERFPIFGHGPLILTFSWSAMAFSALLHEDTGALGGDWPWGLALFAAFATCFIFFLQLRIADEFKDIEEDTRWRPYRPVPRGLIKLRELGWLFVIGAIIQLALALILSPMLVIVLAIAWTYLALMSHEFFAREWLKARPITYLWTHMLIMPLVDLYATACHWLVRDFGVHPGLKWFLAVSFFNGVAIELGRKLRRPADEEEGVDTYTRLWGFARAPWVWFALLVVTAISAVMAAQMIDFVMPVLVVMSVALGAAGYLTFSFVRAEGKYGGKRFETFVGLWTITLYLILGLIPYFLRIT